MKRHRQRDWARLITAIVFFCAFIYFSIISIRMIQSANQTTTENIQPVDQSATSDPIAIATPTSPSGQKTETPMLPPSAMIVVPFTSQAPLANWDALHEDACEEASLIMLHHFEEKTLLGDAQSVENEISDLVNWEAKNGYGPSINLADLAAIAEKKYSMRGIVKAATIDDMKTEVANGNPIIVGAAGKILPNPNFRNGGPNYHMLVIIGYNATDFITNDPGTRNGKNFLYKFADLQNAIHDWNADNILNGEKKYLVF